MSATSSKRRKLDHHGTKHSSSDSSLSDQESSNGFSSGEDAPAPRANSKQQQQKSKHSQIEDEGGLYAGGLFKSSVFKYQVDHLLEDSRPKYDRKFGKANETLGRVKELIEAIEPRDALSVSLIILPQIFDRVLTCNKVTEAIKLIQKSHKIIIPFPSPKPDQSAAYKLSYEKPTNINVVGSYPLKTMTKTASADSALSIDMVVIMPASIFQEKDYLNYRYYYKRAYYLACIAAGLQQSIQEEYTIKFEYLNGNELHPIISVIPKAGEEYIVDGIQ